MNIRALLLDLDGTLIDSTQDIGEAVRHIQKHYDVRLSPDAQVASYIGDGVGMLVARALPGFAEDQLREAVERLKEFYRSHCLDHTTMYPGVPETLAKLSGVARAVVTNKPERISRRILAGLGLDISVVVGGDTLTEKKPDPRPLRHALIQLGDIPSADAVMVGDSAVDVEAGRAAGMRTVGVLSNIGDQKALRAAGPDFLINDFSKLLDLEL